MPHKCLLIYSNVGLVIYVFDVTTGEERVKADTYTHSSEQ